MQVLRLAWDLVPVAVPVGCGQTDRAFSQTNGAIMISLITAQTRRILRIALSASILRFVVSTTPSFLPSLPTLLLSLRISPLAC